MLNNLFDKTQTNFAKLTNRLIQNKITISTMESCTSGLIASFLTDIDNASKVYKGSIVSYSNEVKNAFGVDSKTIEKYGVYSNETTNKMAIAVKKSFASDIGIGVSGTLGIKDPNNNESVPGVVYYTINISDKLYERKIEFKYQGSKFLNKVYVANLICLDLLDII